MAATASASRSSTKHSLPFILSSFRMPPPTSTDPTPSTATTTTGPTPLVSPPSPSHKLSSLESLPADVLGRIAYHVVVDDGAKAAAPSVLLPLLVTSRAIYSAISFDANAVLYNQLFRATFDYAALTRRYEWMVEHLADVAGRGRNVFDLFSDPRAWAIDYQTRWALRKRMRQVVKHKSIDVPGVCDAEQLAGDLWNIWFLLTENDGKNIQFLTDGCQFNQWILVFYRENMLKDSLVPGYPRETGEKALGIWCALLSGVDMTVEQTPADVDEKIFMLRPYVFACAKYDITYAPWHHRRLPLCDPSCTEHAADVTLQSKAMPYRRFGAVWRRAPPHFVLGAYLVFLRLLERQPARVGLVQGSSAFQGEPHMGLFGSSRVMPSIYHDGEWQRNSVCQDPHTSPGLPALAFLGELKGFWRGKFLFYDFDSYRRILAGDMRGVYTGTFAEQAAEMDFKETVIRVRHSELGGSGPLLCAGFREDDVESEAEQRRIEEGYGHEVLTGDAIHEPDEEGWTKEVLISGRCRASWGWGTVRGRIRSWDGLVVLALAHSSHIMGRWLWRGYLHTGGYLVGRWRDTFTAESMRGYEGPFGMVRAGDLCYPSHFPTRIEDSLGVGRISGPGRGSYETDIVDVVFPKGMPVERIAHPDLVGAHTDLPSQSRPSQSTSAQPSTSTHPSRLQVPPSPPLDHKVVESHRTREARSSHILHAVFPKVITPVHVVNPDLSSTPQAGEAASPPSSGDSREQRQGPRSSKRKHPEEKHSKRSRRG